MAINYDLISGGLETSREYDWKLTSVKTSNYQAIINDNIPCDTTGGQFTVTLPNIASGRVRVFDVVGNSATTGFGVSTKSLLLVPSPSQPLQTIMGDSVLELDIGASALAFEVVEGDWRVVGGTTTSYNIDPSSVAGSTIINGSVTRAKLETEVNDTLALIDTALQPGLIFVLTEGDAFVGTNLATIEYFPYAAEIVSLVLVVKTAPTGSTLIVDLHKNDVTILSTKISIDATKTDSTTADTAYVLSSTAIAVGDRLSVDIDQIGATLPGSNVQLIANLVRV